MRASLIFLAAIIALSSDARAARILGLFPHTGKSHHMVFEPLLLKLAEKGHHLTVASFFPLKDPPANYTDVSLLGIAPVGLDNLDLGMFENSNKILKLLGLEKVVHQIAMLSPLDEMALNVCRRLVDWPTLKEALTRDYDLILVEAFNSDCMLGLIHIYGLKAPIVSLSSTSVMAWTAARIGLNDNPSYTPQLSSYFTTRMTFRERLENTFVQTAHKIWFRYNVQVKEQEIIEKHFGKKIPDLEELAKKTSALMINTHYSLNGVRPTIPALIEVGGLHLDDSRKPIPHYIERFLNESDNGVVLVSFGSLIRTSSLPQYKEEMIINALSKIKHRVIWKYEDSDEEGTLIGNILKVKWVPQYELLRHHKIIAFVAHGGLLGMTEAVSAGKPMVVIPFYGDQPNNGAMAEEGGMAKMIPYHDLTEKALTEALEKVLSAELRIGARRMSSIWKDRPSTPLDTAVYWAERIMRWGAQAPLHSAARDLTFIEYNLIDVAFVFILAILVALLLLKFVFSLVPWLIGSGKKEKIH